MDIQLFVKELREQLNKLEQQAKECCHDFEEYPCGCKKCKKCGQIIRCYQNWTWTDWGSGTTNIPLGVSFQI